MDYPNWNTQPYLGTYSQDYSFDLAPLVLSFSAGSGTTVSLINGNLPPGLRWVYPPTASYVLISGVCEPSQQDISSRFTFRLRQTNGTISDRTFTIDLAAPAISPDWSGQRTFLGYQDNISGAEYVVRAVPPPGEHVTYSLVSVPPGNMNIDPVRGILTYNANVISTNFTAVFNVRANAYTTSSDIDLTINVLAPPFLPQWITSAGTLENPTTGTAEFVGGEFVELQLEAEDVLGQEVVYSLIASPPGFPFSLGSTGLLFGEAPDVLVMTDYQFTVRAQSGNGVSDRAFRIEIIPFDQAGLLFWRAPEDLGTINDGRYVEIDAGAVTRRSALISYSVIGGLLPPHLMLNKNTGVILGFCEYVPVGKQYWFEIMADDGVQQIVRQFTLRVVSSYGDQYFGAYLPLTGDLRIRQTQDSSNLQVRAPGSVLQYRMQEIPPHPYLSVINGLVTGYETADQMAARIGPWLHTLDLRMGPVGSSSVQTDGLSVIYRTINCTQQGTNVTVTSSAVYNTNVQTNGIVYPISIENLRQAFSDGLGFVGSGSGKDLILVPVIDWSDGGLGGIIVSNTGRDFKSKPNIIVGGSGTGARVDAILGLVDFNISQQGQGWQVGDTVLVPGNDPITAANLRIISTGTNGSAAAIEIIDHGDYRYVSSAPRTILSKGTASMTIEPVWGIPRVDVIESGSGYQCGISLNVRGGEILPHWQPAYFPAVELGRIPGFVAGPAVSALNQESDSLWGVPWTASNMVWTWQGIRWLGTTTFDDENTTFDGSTTNFQETEDPRLTVFDDQLEVFDDGVTLFDYNDPLQYDLFQLWGGTLLDDGTTAFDLYSTIFDALRPRTVSKTLVSRWITMNNRIYSGNNAVW